MSVSVFVYVCMYKWNLIIIIIIINPLTARVGWGTFTKTRIKLSHTFPPPPPPPSSSSSSSLSPSLSLPLSLSLLAYTIRARMHAHIKPISVVACSWVLSRVFVVLFDREERTFSWGHVIPTVPHMWSARGAYSLFDKIQSSPGNGGKTGQSQQHKWEKKKLEWTIPDVLDWNPAQLSSCHQFSGNATCDSLQPWYCNRKWCHGSDVTGRH